MPEAASARLGLVGPSDFDPITDGDDVIRAIIGRLEAVGMRVDAGSSAARLGAAHVGQRIWWETDNHQALYDDGVDWWPIAPDPAPSTLVDTFANRPSPATLTDGTRFVAADSGMESVVYNGGWVPVGHRIGDTFTTGRTGDSPGGDLLLADGRLIDRTTYAAFFAAVGHAYNGGVDPGSNKVKIPDKRGRNSVGADNMGTAQGAASRIPNSNRALGQNGGEERHILSVSELPGAVFLNTGPALFATGSNMFGQTAASASGGAASQPHNNLQPYEIDNVLVRVA